MKRTKIYYFAHMPAQFAQIIPIFNRLGGKFITAQPFYETWVNMNLKYGLGSTRFIFKKENIHKKVNGVLISQSATNLFNKSGNYVRFYSGHGTSDKYYETPDNKLNIDSFDYFFLTGPKDLHRLKRSIDKPEKLDNKIVPLGAFRSDNIINQVYDPVIIKKKYGINNNKKSILYAPTYKSDGGTLKRCFEKLILDIGQKYNLLIRPHYYDSNLFRKQKKYISNFKLRNVKYIDRYNIDIIELFSISDILIGDRSSVDYDFIFTKKPVIRIKGEYKNYIHPPDKYNLNNYCFHINCEKQNFAEIIKTALSSQEYKNKILELLNNCFYFNDGHAVDRACDFITKTLDEIKD